MSLEYLKKIMSDLDNYKIEEEQTPESQEKEEVIPRSDIYDVMKILDKYRKEDTLKRVYKTDFHYDRNGNTISMVFKIDNFRKSGDFDNVFNSVYIKDLFAELSSLNISKNFVRKISNRNNYKLYLHGNVGIYQTPYFRIL